MVPSVNTATEAIFNQFVPPGVSVHAARLSIPSPIGPSSTEQMNENIERACADLIDVDPDLIVYGVTAGSFLGGVGYDTDLEERISEQADRPTVATAAAARRALDELGIESIAIRTPYVDSLNDLAVEFFEGYGYDVVNITGEGFETGEEYGTSTPEGVYGAVKDMDKTGADGVFISGMEYHGTSLIEPMERDIGMPVVTAHQATLWNAFRETDVDYADIDLGVLFDQ